MLVILVLQPRSARGNTAIRLLAAEVDEKGDGNETDYGTGEAGRSLGVLISPGVLRRPQTAGVYYLFGFSRVEFTRGFADDVPLGWNFIHCFKLCKYHVYGLLHEIYYYYNNV